MRAVTVEGSDNTFLEAPCHLVHGALLGVTVSSGRYSEPFARQGVTVRCIPVASNIVLKTK